MPAPLGPERLRVLELYAGIGGCAAALSGAATVVAAVDIDRRALAVYRRNFTHPTLVRTIESLSPAELAGFRADLWWLSPPCQPFTRRGRRLDDADPRSRSLLALLDGLEEVRPGYVALENVPGFAGSRCHALLTATLERSGYVVREGVLCPTELGVPNRRARYYLVASSRGSLSRWAPAAPAARPPGTLRPYLEPDAGAPVPEALRLDPETARAYRDALDVVHPDAPGTVTACFTAAYGRSPVRSGSYLALPDGGLRRFSPAEVLRLLGFPATYSLPADLPPEKAWPLVGNSLSVPAVRHVLATVPELAALG